MQYESCAAFKVCDRPLQSKNSWNCSTLLGKTFLHTSALYLWVGEIIVPNMRIDQIANNMFDVSLFVDFYSRFLLQLKSYLQRRNSFLSRNGYLKSRTNNLPHENCFNLEVHWRKLDNSSNRIKFSFCQCRHRVGWPIKKTSPRSWADHGSRHNQSNVRECDLDFAQNLRRA